MSKHCAALSTVPNPSFARSSFQAQHARANLQAKGAHLETHSSGPVKLHHNTACLTFENAEWIKSIDYIEIGFRTRELNACMRIAHVHMFITARARARSWDSKAYRLPKGASCLKGEACRTSPCGSCRSNTFHHLITVILGQSSQSSHLGQVIWFH